MDWLKLLNLYTWRKHYLRKCIFRLNNSFGAVGTAAGNCRIADMVAGIADAEYYTINYYCFHYGFHCYDNTALMTMAGLEHVKSDLLDHCQQTTNYFFSYIVIP